ncbi:MAG: hypothetical protein AD742_07875 [Methylibium sp. NZG]|nr:MAG: hypothetical protein AD742_07875 [Methylibium sp. NZG]
MPVAGASRASPPRSRGSVSEQGFPAVGTRASGRPAAAGRSRHARRALLRPSPRRARPHAQPGANRRQARRASARRPGAAAAVSAAVFQRAAKAPRPQRTRVDRWECPPSPSPPAAPLR